MNQHQCTTFRQMNLLHTIKTGLFSLITRFLLCGDSIQSKTNRVCGRIHNILTPKAHMRSTVDWNSPRDVMMMTLSKFVFFFFFQSSACISLHKSLSFLHIIYSFVTAIGVYYIKSRCRLIYGWKLMKNDGRRQHFSSHGAKSIWNPTCQMQVHSLPPSSCQMALN